MIDPEVARRLQGLASKHNLRVIKIDNERPWGGEFIFDEAQLKEFAAAFFPNVNFAEYQNRLGMPKLLIVAPRQRFSWQYHRQRGEWWRVIEGPVGLISSSDDRQGPVNTLAVGENRLMKRGIRHRLVGLDTWGAVAELWLHDDVSNPSVEEDDIRLEDDYNRR